MKKNNIRNKKIKVISGCTIIITLIIICIMFTPLQFIFMEVVDSSRIMDDIQLNKCFNEYINEFNSAQQIFNKYPDIRWIENKSRSSSDSHDGSFTYTTSKGIFVISFERLNDDILKEIDESGIQHILKKLKFKNLTNENNNIVFTQGSSMSCAKGIVYIQDKEKFDDNYIKVKEIEGKWYTFDYK